MALLSLLCVFASAACAQDYSFEARSIDPHQGACITLEGANALSIPNFTVSQGMNWSYPYHRIPVYGENQTIEGAFWGGGSLAGSSIRVSISAFDISALLNAFRGIHGEAKTRYDESRMVLNSSGDAPFALNGTAGGIYTLSATEENNSTVLFATPLLVTTRDVTLQLPADLNAGDTLRIKASIPLEDNQSKIYVAIMISREDYENAKMSLASNGPSDALNTTISIRDRSIQSPGLPRMSSDMLMNAFSLLPPNSAVGLHESEEAEVELQLLTDTQWEKGSYILILIVYSPKEGLIGLKQEVVEVV